MNTKDKIDEIFENEIERLIPKDNREKSFYIKLAGVSHQNEDGSSRIDAIRKCQTFEQLKLVMESDNKFDPNAIAVKRYINDEQIGYLDSRLAGEVTRSVRNQGANWIAIFKDATHHPENNQIVGAVIFMICLTDEFVEHMKNKNV